MAHQAMFSATVVLHNDGTVGRIAWDISQSQQLVPPSFIIVLHRVTQEGAVAEAEKKNCYRHGEECLDVQAGSVF